MASFATVLSAGGACCSIAAWALAPTAKAFVLPNTPLLVPTGAKMSRRAASVSGVRRRRRFDDRTGSLIVQNGGKNIFDCIQEEDVDSVRNYVDQGRPVHVADALGDTLLWVAASTGNVEVVKLLATAEDADVNYPCFHGGETPLMTACSKGHVSVVKYLVDEAGADVNVTNHRGDTALSLAAFWGKVDCLKFLLERPDINTEIQNVQGKRAGEGMEELMRDDTHDEETTSLLRESREDQGLRP